MKRDEALLIRIVDDDVGLDALGYMLETEGCQVRTFHSARDFLTGDTPSIPGVIILDLQMPGMNGLELQRELNRRGSKLPVIFLSAHGDLPKAVEAMKQGSKDFLEKPVDETELLTVLARVIEKDRMERKAGRSVEEVREFVGTLTERERAMANLLALGLLKKAIAERLGISPFTVDAHVQKIYRKLGVHSAAELQRLFAAIES